MDGNQNGYWDGFWRRTASRRRVLGSAGVAGAGFASIGLVGCGSNDDSKGGGAAKSPATADPFVGVKRGGTYKTTIVGDPPVLDPFATSSIQTKTVTSHVYSRLYRFKTGPGVEAPDVTIEGDLVSSTEVSGDGLKWTMKLKPNVKWHDIAPVSGRALTAEDIQYSWSRQVNPKNATSAFFKFVQKIETPDAGTIVFTLANPNYAFADMLADTTNLMILPVEADGGFNPLKQAIGTGPWILDSYIPTVSLNFKRNPNWFDKRAQNFPYLDAAEYMILPSYDSRLAQFLAGFTDRENPNPNDLGRVREFNPEATNIGAVMPQASYLWFDPDPASPFGKDDRVRQAISMSFDRDEIQDLMYDTKTLKAAGLAANNPWNNIVPAGHSRYWLDPRSKDQGDSSRYFRYDPAEAKKLLSAAGYPDGFATVYQYPAAVYGKNFIDGAEEMITYLDHVGIKITTDVQDYAKKWLPGPVAGNLKGMANGIQQSFADPAAYFSRLYTDNGLNFGKVIDPAIEKLIGDQQREPDEQKRKAIFWELQRQAGAKMHYIPMQYGAGVAWSSMQPWLKNADVFQTRGYALGAECLPYYWKTK